MADRVSAEIRSAIMAAVKGKNTSPEKFVRSRIFAEGFRYRLYAKKLPGSPDLVLPRYYVAVFVHGCFWHGHDCPRGRRPRSNQEFWNNKIDRNIERDRESIAALKNAGWSVHVLWTCEIENGLEKLLQELNEKRRNLKSSAPN